MIEHTSKVPTEVLMDWMLSAKEDRRRRHAGGFAVVLQRRGVPLEEMSALLGVRPSTISNWMTWARRLD